MHGHTYHGLILNKYRKKAKQTISNNDTTDSSVFKSSSVPGLTLYPRQRNKKRFAAHQYIDTWAGHGNLWHYARPLKGSYCCVCFWNTCAWNIIGMSTHIEFFFLDRFEVCKRHTWNTDNHKRWKCHQWLKCMQMMVPLFPKACGIKSVTFTRISRRSNNLISGFYQLPPEFIHENHE